MDANIEYYIEYIYGSKIKDNKLNFNCKWKDWSKKQSTIEPMEHLIDNHVKTIRRYQRQSDYAIFQELYNYNLKKGVQVHMAQEKMEILKYQEEEQESAQIKSQQQQQQQQQQQLQQQQQQNSQIPNKKIIKKESNTNNEFCSPEHLEQIKLEIDQLPIEDQIFINSNISIEDKNDPFALLFQLKLNTFNNQYIEIMNELNLQYDTLQYVYPQKQCSQKLLNKPKQKQQLKKTENNSVHMLDFMQTIQFNPEFVLVNVQQDEERFYGQIGFDKVEQIVSHQFGLNSDYQSNMMVDIYFTVQFQVRDNGAQPLENLISVQQAELYERELLIDYVTQHQHLLPQLAKDLLDN